MNICALQLKINSHHLHSPKPSPNSLSSPKLPTHHQLHLKPTPPPPPTTTTTPNLKFKKIPRWVVVGGASSLGFALLALGGADGHHHGQALAFGPEGPMVEEFWDNMRRYGLYVLTVSTGAIYTILQPIVELLKNPITAILLLTVVLGSLFLVSQVLNAMVGISDFSYNYSY